MALLLFESMGILRNEYIRMMLCVFLRNHWNSDVLISSITAPVLFLSGLKDELIPPSKI
jgi:hypothetical protein